MRKAYLKRTKQFHPDLHPNDPKAKAKFQALNEAYDVINDPEKRKLYDQYGERWREGQAFGGAGGAGGAGQSYQWGGGEGSPFEGFDFQASEQVEEASQASSKISSGAAHRPTHAARQADATAAR